MTGNNSYRDKGRAVFFAAMMVLSVVAATATFAGAAAAASDEGDVEYDVSTGEIEGQDLWIGQEVHVVNGTNGFEGAVRVKAGVPGDENADTVKTIRLDNDDNATFTVDSSFEDGEPYFLVDTGSDKTYGEFWANEHQVDFSFSDSAVDNAEAATSNATLEYEEAGNTDRTDNFDVHVTGELEGEALENSTLEEIFADSVDSVDADDDDDVEQDYVVLNTSDANFDVNFAEQEVGDYNFTIDVVDTTASDDAGITVEEAAEPDISFNSNSYDGVVGDNVEMTIDVADATGDDAYVSVTHEDIDGNLGKINITNIGEDEDEVTVILNTYDISQTEAHEDSDANVDIDGFDALEDGGDYQPLPALDYELEALNQYDGDETDAAFLALDERSTDSISTWVVPKNADTSEDLDVILDQATERDYIAQNDTLVTQVEASGVYGYLLDGDNWNEDSGLNLTYEEVDDSAFADPASFNISDLENDGARIVTDEENNTFYVIVNTENVDELEAGQTWDAEFRVTSENAFIDDDASEDDEESVSTQFDVEDREIDFVGEFDDDDRLQVENGQEAEITAETNAAPGTEVDFRIRTETDVQYGDALVDEDGMAAATFDLSGHEAGDDIRDIRVTEADARTSTEGVFVQADEQPAEPAPEFTVDTEAPSEVTVNESAELGVTLANDGDANGTTNLTVTVNGETVDDTTKELAAGEDASFSYDIPTSEAGDVSWEVTVDDDSASGTVTVAEEGDGEDGTDGEDGEDGTDGEDGEDGTDGEDGEDGTDSEDGGDGSDGDSEGQPGFGVAVALVAMLAAAMLALRRQN